MNNLEDLRNKIDGIDRQLIAIFEERMNVVCDIAKFKLDNNLPILNESREDIVIKKAVDNLKNKGFSDSTVAFMQEIMKLSKKEQVKIFSDKK